MEESQFLRLGIFLGVLVLMICLEIGFPRRKRTQSFKQRWVTNLSIALINTVVLRLLGVVSALVVAGYALQQGWGLLSLTPLPYIVDIILGVILLDLAIYVQHTLSHKVPYFWRLHQVHHADRDIDTTTGVRFHPLEIAISMLYKCVIILLLGPLIVSVIIYEVMLNACAMFNHANIKLPYLLDKYLRFLIVTPDMHRVHHSVIYKESNSNYGNILSLWDRVFKTYICQPKWGHDNMKIGLDEAQTNAPSQLMWCLSLPFKYFLK